MTDYTGGGEQKSVGIGILDLKALFVFSALSLQAGILITTSFFAYGVALYVADLDLSSKRTSFILQTQNFCYS